MGTVIFHQISHEVYLTPLCSCMYMYAHLEYLHNRLYHLCAFFVMSDISTKCGLHYPNYLNSRGSLFLRGFCMTLMRDLDEQEIYINVYIYISRWHWLSQKKITISLIHSTLRQSLLKQPTRMHDILYIKITSYNVSMYNLRQLRVSSGTMFIHYKCCLRCVRSIIPNVLQRV